MTGKISLTASMRSNLLSLQNISRQVSATQNKLATGNKVNSAIDNPSSYYTARALNNRADDLNALLNSMGQAVSTIKAATEGLEAATGLLEQLRAVTEQTLTEAPLVPCHNCAKLENNVDELLAQGYTAISKDMTADEIKAIVSTRDAKVVLVDDITLDSSITLNNLNITINGGGHTLTCYGIYNYSGGATIENIRINNNKIQESGSLSSIYITAANTTLRNIEIFQNGSPAKESVIELHGGNNTIENIDIHVRGSERTAQLTGIEVWGSGTINNVSVDATASDDSTLISAINSRTDELFIKDIGIFANGGTAYGVIGAVSGISTRPIGGTASRPSALFDGKANTQAILDFLGSQNSVAWIANQFVPDNALKNNADFAQGSWYLPAIGELMEMYGLDTSQVTGGYASTSGATEDNKEAINNALIELEQYGIAERFSNYYWSSSEYFHVDVWTIDMRNGQRAASYKAGQDAVRVFNEVENLDFSAGQPKIGDVMYADKSWGSAADYDPDSGKIAVGIVANVDAEHGSVKLVNLKDLTFNSTNNMADFNPDDPYGGTFSAINWSCGPNMYKNVEEIDNYLGLQMVLALNPNLPCVGVDTLNEAFAQPAADDYQAQYNAILDQYDALINDSSYKGINLLKGGELNVRFNEQGSSTLAVSGKDISSAAVGLSLADWAKKEGILQSVQELSSAVAQLRSYAAELGNHYSIITSRQDFTENLINILTEGADKLTLADMNEESANMLALQTRQQLAVNSLSLASQASQSVLRLF